MWSFLIQKEGEEQWKSVPQEKVVLTEGRYRLILNCGLPHSPIKTSIFYIKDLVNTQSLQKHEFVHRANDHGIIVLFPYRKMIPGLWQVVCTNGSMQAKIDFEIVSQINKISEQITVDLTSQAKLEQLIRNEIEPYLEKHSQQSIVGSKLLPELELTLTQNQFFSLQGELLPVFGRIEMKDAEFPYLIQSNFRIHYRLKCPFKDEYLISQEQYITIENLPFDFQYFLELPNNLESNAFKGEVILETLYPKVNVLAKKVFSLITENNKPLQKVLEIEEEEPTGEKANLQNSNYDHPALPNRLDDTHIKSKKEVNLPPIP